MFCSKCSQTVNCSHLMVSVELSKNALFWVVTEQRGHSLKVRETVSSTKNKEKPTKAATLLKILYCAVDQYKKTPTQHSNASAGCHCKPSAGEAI